MSCSPASTVMARARLTSAVAFAKGPPQHSPHIRIRPCAQVDYDELNKLFAEYTDTDTSTPQYVTAHTPGGLNTQKVADRGSGLVLDVRAVDGGKLAQAVSAAATRGLIGGVRDAGDAELLRASLVLLKTCCEEDAQVCPRLLRSSPRFISPHHGPAQSADELWADEPLCAALCACMDTVGVETASVVRLGGTRSVFVTRPEVTERSRTAGGLGKGSGTLAGWQGRTAPSPDLASPHIALRPAPPLPPQHGGAGGAV